MMPQIFKVNQNIFTGGVYQNASQYLTVNSGQHFRGLSCFIPLHVPFEYLFLISGFFFFFFNARTPILSTFRLYFMILNFMIQ